MEKIKLAHTDLEVSRISAGCMGLGGGWEMNTQLTSEHEKQASDFIDAALQENINFFDTANIYARGRSEEVFGRVLAKRPGLREQIVIQSKCGIRWQDDPAGAPQRFDFSERHILDAVDASLKRLHTEYMDILLLHRPDVLWEGEEIARAFESLKKSGKVRYFGVSNQNRFQMEYLQSFLPDPLVANQLQMSLLHSGFAEVGISFNQNSPHYPDGWEGVLEYCRLKGVSLQAWSPLDRGVLLGEDLSKLPENRRKAAELLRQYARVRGVSTDAVALAWLLRHPARIVPVIGTAKPERIASAAKAVKFELSREEWYSLFEAARGLSMP
ncbi:Oxidoreductase YdhF [bioreactor metagenome]|uniref:Oxidoreductase YdhF n=1 Tax=bioreactor metagenome TaxID=1076179 RepID=A0A644YK32_9ZZZZ